MYPRGLEGPVREALTDTPVVVIVGPRQVGKSTLAQAVVPRPDAYQTLDEAVTLAAAAGDPPGFIAGLPDPAVIDEVQRVPNLMLAIKESVDQDRRPGRFLLTGSADIFALPTISETLAGRVEVLTLWPLSQDELAGTPASLIDELFAGGATARNRSDSAVLTTRLTAGGFPEAVRRTDPQRRSRWFSSYVTTILQRDVRDLANIEALADLPRLLTLLSTRSAKLLNFADIGRDLQFPQTSLKRYFALLENVFLVRRVPAWLRNPGQRLIKSPKPIVVDTGLQCHLLGANDERLRREASLLGSVVETFVIMELTKQIGWSKTDCGLFHYRTAAGVEVDAVLEARDGAVVGIEVKSGLSVSPDDFRGLQALRDAAGSAFRAGAVLYAGSKTVSFEPGLQAVPLSALWTPPS